MSLIFLIGMPAAGKTYWGSKVAENFGLNFVDLDVYLGQQLHTTIPAIFATRGETAFRQLEHDALVTVIKDNTGHTIVACGGGTPCYHDNISLMLAAGQVVYLQAHVSELLHNLANDNTERPLLQNQHDTTGYYQRLLTLRSSIYERAHHILPVSNISLNNFAQIIDLCTNRHL